MDAPNAPNPANPNAQGQNVDAELGPANQVQALWCKIRLRVLQIKIKFKYLWVKFQLKVLHRLFKMYLSNHYNNWLGKKPEFSGKP